MEYKKRVSFYLKYLDDMLSKPMRSTVYSKWLPNYLDCINHLPMDDCVAVIFGALGCYIQAVRREKETYFEAYQKIVEVDRPILNDFSWALETTIKQKKYKRINSFDRQGVETDLSNQISNLSLQLAYTDAINFMGELAGAWVLTYPIEAIKKQCGNFMPVDWAKDEEDYIFILDLRLEIELDEWRK